MSLRSGLQRGLAVLLSLVLTLAFAELILQIADYPPQQVSGWKAEDHPLECNQLGFRGRIFGPPGPAYRILLVGDSQVAAWAQSFTEMPEQLLEKWLREKMGAPVSVVTIGTDGYGQDQQFLAMQEYFESYSADLVLLWYTLGNDLENTTFCVTASGTPKPTYWLEESELRGPNEPWLEPLGSPSRLISLLSPYSIEERLAGWDPYLPPVNVPPGAWPNPVSHDWQEAWDEGRTFGFRDMAREMTTSATSIKPRSLRTQYSLDLSRSLLEAMGALAARHGARFRIFFELRGEPDRNPAVVAQLLNGSLYPISEAQRWQSVDELFEGLPHERILIDFPEVTVSEWDGHLNLRAVDHVMEGLAQRLVDGGVVPKGPEPPSVGER